MGRGSTEATDFNRLFGERMAARREELEWPRWKLAAAVDLSPDTIRRYELGDTGPSIPDAMRIAQALGVPLSRLMPNGGEEAA